MPNRAFMCGVGPMEKLNFAFGGQTTQKCGNATLG